MIQIDKKNLVINFLIFVFSCFLTIVILIYSLSIDIPVLETGVVFLLLMSPVFLYYVYLNIKTTKKVNKLIEKTIEDNKYAKSIENILNN